MSGDIGKLYGVREYGYLNISDFIINVGKCFNIESLKKYKDEESACFE